MGKAKGLKALYRIFFIVMIGVIVFLTGTRATRGNTKRALLIGISDYSNSGMASLRGPGNDIPLIKKILIDRLKFPETNIIVLTGAKATHTGLENAFFRLSQLAEAGDFIYIHYCLYLLFTT